MRIGVSVTAVSYLIAGVLVGASSGLEAAPRQSTDVQVEIYAMSPGPGVVLYSIFVANRGPALGDVSVAVGLPEGTALGDVLATPSRALRGRNEGDRIVWRIDSVPAHRRLGPFGFRAHIITAPGPVRAESSWSSPSRGSAAARVDGAEAAHASVEDLKIGPTGTAGLTPLPGTGFSYLLRPGAESSTLRLSKTDGGPPAHPSLEWVARFEGSVLGAQGTTSLPLALVLPLDRPLPSFMPLWPYIEQDNMWAPQTSLATVTADGLHAVVAPDHFSRIALGAPGRIVEGLEEPRLEDRLGEIRQAKAESLRQAIIETLIEVLSLVEGRPVDVPVIRTDGWTTPDGGQCESGCTSGDYCFQVCCYAGYCVVCSGDPDDWDCEIVQGNSAVDPTGDILSFTDAFGTESRIDELVELPDFFQGLGQPLLDTVAFLTPVLPALGGSGVQVQDGAGITNLLPATAVLDGRVQRILGSGGTGQTGILRSNLGRAYLGILEMRALLAVTGKTARCPSNLSNWLRRAFLALHHGDVPRAASLLESVRGFLQRHADRLSKPFAEKLMAQIDSVLALIAASAP